MARYKTNDLNPKFLPVDLARQLCPGTFEHALNHLLDHELDVSGIFTAHTRSGRFHWASIGVPIGGRHSR